MKKILIISSLFGFFILVLIIFNLLYNFNYETSQVIKNETAQQSNPEADISGCGDKANEPVDACGKNTSRSSDSKVVKLLTDDGISKHLK